jgi:hypothetical protein
VRLPAALLAALALAACAGAQSPAKPAPGAAAFYAAQVLELRDAALNAHDADGAAAAYAVDAVVIDAYSGAVVLRGRAAIREAHARFLAECPRARLEVLDRVYDEQARIVSGLERVRCDRPPGIEGQVRYEFAGGAIVRVLKQRSPPFGG